MQTRTKSGRRACARDLLNESGGYTAPPGRVSGDLTSPEERRCAQRPQLYATTSRLTAPGRSHGPGVSPGGPERKRRTAQPLTRPDGGGIRSFFGRGVAGLVTVVGHNSEEIAWFTAVTPTPPLNFESSRPFFQCERTRG